MALTWTRGQRLIAFPRHGWLGLILIAICWPLNWTLPGPRTSFFFFPLWLGYILLADGLVLFRTGTSLLRRSRYKYVFFFLLSTPAWWIFEIFNSRIQNWEYLGAQEIGGAGYLLFSTLAFSTVVPAVFETAELVRSFGWIERFAQGPRIRKTGLNALVFFGLGLAMVGLTLRWPQYCYPLVWTGVFMLVEPFNVWLGNPSLLERLDKADWRPVIALSVGAIICGFFWEMWNFFSVPKWVYHVPYVGVFRIFEMPILGYLGYIPFAWELFALSYFFWPKAPPLRI